MQKTCLKCHTHFEITNEDLEFYNKVSPIFAGKKSQIPTPTLCPDCRQQRRLAFRNERSLYTRTCDLCKKSIITIYSADKPYTVYCHDCWWSDGWDAKSFGRDIDWGKPFFEQFDALKKQVPHMALHASQNENSDYINLSGYNKNCYLIFAAEYDENCLYGTQIIKSQNCIDTLNCLDSRLCYDVVDTENCYQLYFSQNCKNCSDSMFLYDCRSVTNSLFCTNLRNKQYHIFNKPYPKEEFEKKKQEIMEKLQKGQLEELKAQFGTLKKEAIHRDLEMVNCENSLGDYLSDCKNAQICFDLTHSQDSKYVYTGYSVKDLMDVAHTTDVELAYEGTSIGYKSYNVHFSMGSWTSNNSFYSDNCHNSANIFGCVDMRRAQFCILNKEYSTQEYEVLVARLIEHMVKNGEWGEFFPMKISPFAYNESKAQEYFPLTQNQAEAKNYSWKSVDKKEYQPQTKEILACIQCGKNYRMVTLELNFYQKAGLPLPQKCPDCRHQERMNKRNPRKIIQSNCHNCHKEIQTTHSNMSKKIYCEECYLKEVY